MKIIHYPLQTKQWIATETKKKYVIWHGSFGRTKYTPYGKESGRATSTIDNWNHNSEKFGAPYLIDRDGAIYKTFSDNEWIYHLNIPTTKGFYDKQSVPIVLANEQQLIKENNRYFAFEYPHSTSQYHGKVYEKDWRGHKYWASMDTEQVDALIELTLDICDRHKIKPVLYSKDDWNPKVWDTATVFTHANTKREVYDFTLEPWVLDKIRASKIKVI